MSHAEYVTRMAMVFLLIWFSVFFVFMKVPDTREEWVVLFSSAFCAVAAAIVLTA